MSEGELEAMFDTCFEYDDHLRTNGHWAGGEAFEPPDAAVTVSWEIGKVATTDGPYAKTKAHLVGILILVARDMHHAPRSMSHQPAVEFGSIFETRPVPDMSERIKAGILRRIAPQQGCWRRAGDSRFLPNRGGIETVDFPYEERTNPQAKSTVGGEPRN